MIPAEAVEAAAKEIDAPSEPAAQEIARRALEAAAPYMLADILEDAANTAETDELTTAAEVMSPRQKAAFAYMVLCVALIVIGFGPLEDWQAAVRNGALVAGAIFIALVPATDAK